MWFPISGERRVHVVPCAQTGGGMKGQSDLGFSWGCGKLPGVGTAQRPGGGHVESTLPPPGPRSPPPPLPASLSTSVLPPRSQAPTGCSPRTQQPRLVVEAQGGLRTSATQTGASLPSACPSLMTPSPSRVTARPSVSLQQAPGPRPQHAAQSAVVCPSYPLTGPSLQERLAPSHEAPSGAPDTWTFSVILNA